MGEQLQLGDFAPFLRDELSQWHTPPDLCVLMASWIRHGVTDVLEPSAGGGNIVQAILDRWNLGEPPLALPKRVHAVEIDPDWKRFIEKRFEGQPVSAWDGDFLEMPVDLLPKCGAAVMNPPLDAGEGPHHVAHALEFAPQVISILRGQDMHNKGAYKVLWSKCRLVRIAHLGRPKFGGGGGAKSDFVLVHVREGRPAAATEVTWWGLG